MVFSQIQSARRGVKKNDEYPGVLGDGFGNVHAGDGQYWVRFPAGANPDGQTMLSAPRAIRYDAESPIIGRDNADVLVQRDSYDGVEKISRMEPTYTNRVGIDSKILNFAEPSTKWVDVRNFIRLLSRPTGSGFATSGNVTIREDPFHVNDFNEFSSFTGTLPDDQLDIVTDFPTTAGNHRVVIIFFDRLANAPVAYGSTEQSLSIDIDTTDYDECFDQLLHNEFTPLVAIGLADAQTTTSAVDVIEDLRTWLPTPRIYGFPNPIPANKAIFLRATHQQLVSDMTVLGDLTIEGELTVI